MEDMLLAVRLEPNCRSYKKQMIACWQNTKDLLEQDFQAMCGRDVLASAKREAARQRALQRAQAQTQQQLQARNPYGNGRFDPANSGYRDPLQDLYKRNPRLRNQAGLAGRKPR